MASSTISREKNLLEAEDCVHCFLCLKAVKLNHVAAKKDEAAFVSVLLSIFNISNSYNFFLYI